VSSSEHYKAAFTRGEACRGDRASAWNRSQRDEVISASHASREPTKSLRSNWDSSRRLGRSVHKTEGVLDGKLGHAWEKASLRVLLQAGKSEDNAVEFSTRVIDRILPRASERSKRSSETSPARRPANSASERAVVDSSTGDANHQLSPSDSSRWYRKPNGGVWTFGVPTKSSNATSDPSATRKPDVHFSQRLQQSRAAITMQVHKQLNSHATPIQAAIGRLPLYQSQKSAQSQQSMQTVATTLPHGPPIIYAIAGPSEQQPQEQLSDMESFVSRHKQSSNVKKMYDFPAFPSSIEAKTQGSWRVDGDR
jgi:hypothetical protein